MKLNVTKIRQVLPPLMLAGFACLATLTLSTPAYAHGWTEKEIISLLLFLFGTPAISVLLVLLIASAVLRKKTSPSFGRRLYAIIAIGLASLAAIVPSGYFIYISLFSKFNRFTLYMLLAAVLLLTTGFFTVRLSWQVYKQSAENPSNSEKEETA